MVLPMAAVLLSLHGLGASRPMPVPLSAEAPGWF